MHLDEAVSRVVSKALESYRKERNYKAALQIVIDAVISEEISLAYMDEAKDEFALALKELVEEEDGIVPDEWERISRHSFLELIGSTTEHTETDIETTGVKSGSIIPIAEETAP